MADVHDILGVGGGQKPPPGTAVLKRRESAGSSSGKQASKGKRQPRELLSLAGNWSGQLLPTLAPSVKPVFKQKRCNRKFFGLVWWFVFFHMKTDVGWIWLF